MVAHLWRRLCLKIQFASLYKDSSCPFVLPYLYNIDPIKMVEGAGKSAATTTTNNVSQTSTNSQTEIFLDYFRNSVLHLHRSRFCWSAWVGLAGTSSLSELTSFLLIVRIRFGSDEYIKDWLLASSEYNDIRIFCSCAFRRCIGAFCIDELQRFFSASINVYGD